MHTTAFILKDPFLRHLNKSLYFESLIPLKIQFVTPNHEKKMFYKIYDVAVCKISAYHLNSFILTPLSVIYDSSIMALVWLAPTHIQMILFLKHGGII